jgi:hypothetical protein
VFVNELVPARIDVLLKRAPDVLIANDQSVMSVRLRLTSTRILSSGKTLAA